MVSLDSQAIAVEGVGFDSSAMAAQGFGAFDLFELEKIFIDDPAAFRFLSNRRPRGRSTRWKQKRHIVVVARLNRTWLDEATTKEALAEQLVDDESPTIIVLGRRVSLMTREPIAVTVTEAKANLKPFRVDT